jgi:hypothetical protein
MFVFLHALRNGTTTIIDVWADCAGTGMATPGWWTTSACASTAARPSATRDTFMYAQGRLTHEEDVAGGRERLKEAVGFVKSYRTPTTTPPTCAGTSPRSPTHRMP